MNISMILDREEEIIREVLDNIPPFEISFTHIPYPGMGVGDCVRYLKCPSDEVFYIKQGMHGSNGSWKLKEKEVAIKWLLEAAINNVKVFGSHSDCTYSLKITDNKPM